MRKNKYEEHKRMHYLLKIAQTNISNDFRVVSWHKQFSVVKVSKLPHIQEIVWSSLRK